MFDEYPGVEKQSDDEQEFSGDLKSTWWFGRWAHVITIPVWFIFLSRLQTVRGAHMYQSPARTPFSFFASRREMPSKTWTMS
jgi:hypothetical protein